MHALHTKAKRIRRRTSLVLSAVLLALALLPLRAYALGLATESQGIVVLGDSSDGSGAITLGESSDDADAITIGEPSGEPIPNEPMAVAAEAEHVTSDQALDGDLLEQYIEHEFGEAASSQAPALFAMADATATLGERELALYRAAKDFAAEVAAGRRTSTVLEVPLSELGYDGPWTAADLGVDTLVSGNMISSQALVAARERMSADFSAVLDALLADCPYELYWFDKVSGLIYSPCGSYGCTYSNGEYRLYCNGGTRLSFFVSPEYSASGASGTMEANPSMGSLVSASVARARDIASAYASEQPYERLHSYLQEVCDLVSYNYDALDNGAPFGNPWQLVWVFDGDASTNVVCEGYAKAFKYLCDLSGDESVSCLLASGRVGGGLMQGDHMWNVVGMDDGRNYLVDPTSCDGVSYGSADSFFLAAGLSGSWNGTYSLEVGGRTTTYAYDSETKGLFGQARLTISDRAYEAPDAPVSDGWVDLDGGGKGYARDGFLVKGWMDLGSSKYWFGEEGRMASGWTDVVVGGKTMHYYFNPASGNLVRDTWFEIDGKKYYFRPSGNLATGWATIADGGVDKKYYFEGDGALVAGCWRDIDTGQGYAGHYYFRPSGAMATGWATIDGEKYWFRPSGNMATGFADVDDAYKRYFDADGHMLIGWQQIGGKTYYFRPSGAMQTGMATIDGRSYSFSDKGVLSG